MKLWTRVWNKTFNAWGEKFKVFTEHHFISSTEFWAYLLMAFYSLEMTACIRYTTPRAKVLLNSWNIGCLWHIQSTVHRKKQYIYFLYLAWTFQGPVNIATLECPHSCRRWHFAFLFSPSYQHSKLPPHPVFHPATPTDITAKSREGRTVQTMDSFPFFPLQTLIKSSEQELIQYYTMEWRYLLLLAQRTVLRKYKAATVWAC